MYTAPAVLPQLGMTPPMAPPAFPGLPPAGALTPPPGLPPIDLTPPPGLPPLSLAAGMLPPPPGFAPPLSPPAWLPIGAPDLPPSPPPVGTFGPRRGHGPSTGMHGAMAGTRALEGQGRSAARLATELLSQLRTSLQFLPSLGFRG